MKSSILTLSVLIALMAGCDDDNDKPKGDADPSDGDAGPGDDTGGEDDELRSDLIAKTLECKIHPGTPSEDEYSIKDDYDRCAARCVIAGTCDDLRELACTSGGLPTNANPFVACLEKCPFDPADGYACSDGTKIPHAGVCDGFEDCEDEADETDCGEHVCDDGETISIGEVTCDGFEDCSDGSDEAGCPAVCG